MRPLVAETIFHAYRKIFTGKARSTDYWIAAVAILPVLLGITFLL